MKILEELYFGNIKPNIQRIDEGSKLWKATTIMEDNQDELMKMLEGKEKQLFIELMKAHSEINEITSVEKFRKGFQLGANFMHEIMDDENTCLRDM